MPRAALPGVLMMFVAVEAGFTWKQPVLKYRSNVCGAFAFGSQRTFGLLPATSAEILPRPDASNDEVVTVNGSPDCAVAMPENCHPPRAFPTKSFRLLRSGTS